MGVMAQLRKDYDTAEREYRRALEIFEKLGNRAEMASSISQLGVLRTQQNRPEEGLVLNLQSLAIRSQIGHSDIRIDLHWLLRQREMLGKERFEALVAEKVDDEELRQNLYAMMEAYEQARKEAEESTQDSDGDKGEGDE